MANMDLTRLILADMNVDSIRDYQIFTIRELGGFVKDNATLRECADAIGTVANGSHMVRCLSVNADNKTWQGYEGSFDSTGSWVYNYTEPVELKYKFITPEEGFIYNSDARIRVNAINCDPRQLDIFVGDRWEKDPENRKVEIIRNEITGDTTEIIVTVPDSTTKLKFFYGTPVQIEDFGILNDVERTYCDNAVGRDIIVPGGELSCVATSHYPCVYDVGEYTFEDNYDSGDAIGGGAVFHSTVWKSKDFSYFCWQKGPFRGRDVLLHFVAPDDAAPNDADYCVRFALFSEGYYETSTWKPGYMDRRVNYGSDSGRGDFYHDTRYEPVGGRYNTNYWHLWGVTYDHVKRELCGWIDGELVDTFKIENDFQLSIMDIYGCTVRIGWAGRADVSISNNSRRYCVGPVILSGTCFTPEQIKYLANDTESVTRNKPIIVASDQSFTGYVGEESEWGISVRDNFSGEYGSLKLKATGLPSWVSYFSDGAGYESTPYFYGTPDAPGVYTFDVTVTGVMTDGGTAPDPVSFKITINVEG